MSRIGWLLTLAVVSAAPTAAAAQGLVQRAAVGSCQSTNDAMEMEYQGATYLVPSNMASATFHCPIDAALAPPGAIGSATVWVGDPSVSDNASVQLCFTNLADKPNEVCGKPTYSSGAGYFVQSLVALPPALELRPSHVAFLKVYVPTPDPPGYGFFRGFRID